VIAVDTSGSIDRKALNHFAAEASGVLGAYDTTVRVIYCDTKVQKEEVFTKADLPMKMKPVGGGGTDFRPAFKYVDKKGYTPACLIYFTDMYGDFPRQEPDYPVMWLTATERKTAPFGQTVLFKMNN
jgi:predicted metal-dependent peptidase